MFLLGSDRPLCPEMTCFYPAFICFWSGKCYFPCRDDHRPSCGNDMFLFRGKKFLFGSVMFLFGSDLAMLASYTFLFESDMLCWEMVVSVRNLFATCFKLCGSVLELVRDFFGEQCLELFGNLLEVGICLEIYRNFFGFFVI